MNCLTRNCRGLGNPRTIDVLKDLVQTKRPQFLFLMKTLINKAKIEPIRDMLGYEGCFVVDNLGHNRGLAMLWKEKPIAVVTGH